MAVAMLARYDGALVVARRFGHASANSRVTLCLHRVRSLPEGRLADFGSRHEISLVSRRVVTTVAEARLGRTGRQAPSQPDVEDDDGTVGDADRAVGVQVVALVVGSPGVEIGRAHV